MTRVFILYRVYFFFILVSRYVYDQIVEHGVYRATNTKRIEFLMINGVGVGRYDVNKIHNMPIFVVRLC